jgi:hypothetical protein
MKDGNDYINTALQIIASLGLPRAQQNERSALCLLALLNLTPGKMWKDAENPLVGITPIMDWARCPINCRAGLCDCLPGPGNYGPLPWGNRLGNGGVGGGCTISLDPL